MPKVELFCSWCGKKFVDYPSQKRYCSPECGSECGLMVRFGVREKWVEEDHGFGTPCWIWQLATDGRYGRATNEETGKTVSAHVLYYERVHGPVPDGLHIHHECRQKLCVNPDHMRIETPLDHQRKHARLSLEIAREMRALRPGMTYQQIADRYGVSISSAHAICTGKTWAEEVDHVASQSMPLV